MYRWNIKKRENIHKINTKIKPNPMAINKRCIYMQMFKDLLCTKEWKIIHRHILLLDIRLWLKVAFHCFVSLFLNYILKRNFNHKVLSPVLWKMGFVKMRRLTHNSGRHTGNLKRDITPVFTIYGRRRNLQCTFWLGSFQFRLGPTNW